MSTKSYTPGKQKLSSKKSKWSLDSEDFNEDFNSSKKKSNKYKKFCTDSVQK